MVFALQLSENATGVIQYGIMIFASETKVIVNLQDLQPSTEQIRTELVNIGLNRGA